MSLRLVIGVVMLIVLSACGSGQQAEQSSTSSVSLHPIEVTIMLPDSLEPNQQTTLRTLVTQGEEKVNDAHEVVFEIWKQGEEHQELKAELEGDGVYAVDTTFEEKGIYYMISHVTARQMHNMPKKQFTVGDVTVTDQPEEKNDDLLIHVTPKQELVAESAISFTTFLEKDQEEIVGALVEYAIINDNGDTLTYVTAEEKAPGQYVGDVTFPKQGTYNLAVHVRKDELRKHIKKSFDVQ